jgi:acetylglutamate kinase
LDKNGELIPNLNERVIHQLIEDGTIRDGMLPKINNALNALKSGAKSVYVLGSDFYKYPVSESGTFYGTKLIL